MFEKEIEKYNKLNNIAEGFGTVILGNGEDAELPVSELADSFGAQSKFYNRSAEHLSITEAISYYDAVVKALNPSRVILHIGSDDIELFKESAVLFDSEYCKLIEHIRKNNKGCNIGIMSLCNPDFSDAVKEINSHLRMIAEQQHCEFEDISKPKICNLIEIKTFMSFAASMGLSKRAKYSSLYDLAKIFSTFNHNV